VETCDPRQAFGAVTSTISAAHWMLGVGLERQLPTNIAFQGRIEFEQLRFLSGIIELQNYLRKEYREPNRKDTNPAVKPKTQDLHRESRFPWRTFPRSIGTKSSAAGFWETVACLRWPCGLGKCRLHGSWQLGNDLQGGRNLSTGCLWGGRAGPAWMAIFMQVISADSA